VSHQRIIPGAPFVSRCVCVSASVCVWVGHQTPTASFLWKEQQCCHFFSAPLCCCCCCCGAFFYFCVTPTLLTASWLLLLLFFIGVTFRK